MAKSRSPAKKVTPAVPTATPEEVKPGAVFSPKKNGPMTRGEMSEEVTRCVMSCEHFISHHCVIDDKSLGKKFKFVLWEKQKPVLELFVKERKVVVLKARQIGLTWLALCKALWTALLEKPGSTILLFSLRDDEAKELLVRVKGVYNRLPDFLKCRETVKDDAHELKLSNGSEFKAFPTGKGDSYTASMAVLDEFDLLEPEMQTQMLESIEPTVRAAGQLLLISKANKKVKWSTSQFKKIYTAARTGNDPLWKSIFLPWWARPDFSQDDYDAEKQKCFDNTGSYDAHYGNYPESDEQALAPSSSDKRFPFEWLKSIRREQRQYTPEMVRDMVPQLTHIRGLRIYKDVVHGRKYVGGVDPAEGTEGSNPSAIVLLDAVTGEEVLSMNERLTPKQTGVVMKDISKVYGNASWLPERNNHGHALINYLRDNTEVRLLEGHDGKPGWLSGDNQRRTGVKTHLYDYVADSIRDGFGIIHSFDLYMQMSMVESDTLDSPTTPGNNHGDLASAFVLAVKGCDIDKSGNFKPSDFQWGDTGSAHRPFGTEDPRRPSGVFGTRDGGGGSPFGTR